VATVRKGQATPTLGPPVEGATALQQTGETEATMVESAAVKWCVLHPLLVAIVLEEGMAETGQAMVVKHVAMGVIGIALCLEGVMVEVTDHFTAASRGGSQTEAAM